MAKGQSTTTQTNKVDPRQEARSDRLGTQAEAQPSSYTAQPRSATINSGYQGVRAGIDQTRTAYQPWHDKAQSSATAAYTDNAAKAPAFDNASMSRFVNPHEADVIGGVRRDHEKNLTMALNAGRGNAAAAGAFGGGRHGVREAVTAGNAVDSLDRTIAGLRSDNFNRSVDSVFRDNAASNAAAGQNYSQGMGYSERMANLGQMETNNLANNNNAAFALTNQLQGLEQGAFDRASDESRYAAEYGLNSLAKKSSINAGSPYTSISTGTTTQPNNTLGTALYAAGSFLPMAMKSDERAKENIEDLNPERILGAFAELPTKSYDYKAEHRDGPMAGHGRRDGFMAQDYERIFQTPSREIDGVKTIDVPQLLGRVVTAIKGLEARTRPLKGAH